MTTVVLSGTAPDGSPLTVSVDLCQHDDETYPAAYGTGIRAWCTLPRYHPGPWHVAATGTAIITREWFGLPPASGRNKNKEQEMS